MEPPTLKISSIGLLPLGAKPTAEGPGIQRRERGRKARRLGPVNQRMGVFQTQLFLGFATGGREREIGTGATDKPQPPSFPCWASLRSIMIYPLSIIGGHSTPQANVRCSPFPPPNSNPSYNYSIGYRHKLLSDLPDVWVPGSHFFFSTYKQSQCSGGLHSLPDLEVQRWKSLRNIRTFKCSHDVYWWHFPADFCIWGLQPFARCLDSEKNGKNQKPTAGCKKIYRNTIN